MAAPAAERPRRDAGAASGSYWLFGDHAVSAALGNPQRTVRRLIRVSQHSMPEWMSDGTRRPDGRSLEWENVQREDMDRLLPAGSVHQGVAALVEPLPERTMEDIIKAVPDRDQAVILILDQVTDPHNVGAILRSAAAFGAIGVVLTERHGAPESGTLARAASGALEHVPLIRVANLSRAMESLKKQRFWIAGLAAEAEPTLAQAALNGRIALALGAEGAGLRRLTREYCDYLVRLPTAGPINQLNVSNAAAVALYELNRR